MTPCSNNRMLLSIQQAADLPHPRERHSTQHRGFRGGHQLGAASPNSPGANYTGWKQSCLASNYTSTYVSNCKHGVGGRGFSVKAWLGDPVHFPLPRDLVCARVCPHFPPFVHIPPIFFEFENISNPLFTALSSSLVHLNLDSNFQWICPQLAPKRACPRGTWTQNDLCPGCCTPTTAMGRVATSQGFLGWHNFVHIIFFCAHPVLIQLNPALEKRYYISSLEMMQDYVQNRIPNHHSMLGFCNFVWLPGLQEAIRRRMTQCLQSTQPRGISC